MPSETEIVEAQIGRPVERETFIAAKCHLGLPVVVGGSATLVDGRPFPTRYWLSCPLAVKRIGQLESEGAVKLLDQRIKDDVDFASAVSQSHDEHDDSVNSTDRRGIGGTRNSVKCLHSHAAYQLAGGASPVGQWTLAAIGELDCGIPCVVDSAEGEGCQRNPEWTKSSSK